MTLAKDCSNVKAAVSAGRALPQPTEEPTQQPSEIGAPIIVIPLDGPPVEFVDKPAENAADMPELSAMTEVQSEAPPPLSEAPLAESEPVAKVEKSLSGCLLRTERHPLHGLPRFVSQCAAEPVPLLDLGDLGLESTLAELEFSA
eukprot:m.196345 g.196345  ORF g.196345 m.196345 type:complete len:145 (+) comp53745_c0_seq1:896-1330(+)